MNKTMKIKPALTAEGWARSELLIDPEDDPKHRHQYAALALHGQPFGFTREDVENVRDTVSAIWSSVPSDAAAPWGRAMESLADRIEALLPPEDDQR